MGQWLENEALTFASQMIDLEPPWEIVRKAECLPCPALDIRSRIYIFTRSLGESRAIFKFEKVWVAMLLSYVVRLFHLYSSTLPSWAPPSPIVEVGISTTNRLESMK